MKNIRKNKKNRIIKSVASIFALTLSIALMTACGSSDKSNDEVKNESGSIKVFTSIYPLEYLANEIAKDKAEVSNIVPVGTESHDFEPTGREVAKIKESDLFVFVGSGMESWGEKLSDSMQDHVLEASEYVELIDLEADQSEHKDEHDEHNHDEHDEDMENGHDEQEHDDHEGHNHGSSDPHIWTSPKNMVKIAEKIKDKLSEIDEANSEEYQKNYEELAEKLNNLDQKYETELADRKSDTFLVSHKAFSYLAKDYGLNQVSVTGVTPFSEPSPKTIAALIDTARKEDLSYIYFETLASPKSVQTIADEAKLEALTLNPLEGLTEEDVSKNKDYISIMEENLESLKKELMK